jgi:hypothetical protein
MISEEVDDADEK